MGARPYRVEVLQGEDVFTPARGRIYQRGFYEFVLCEDCNKFTGAKYGGEFARWSDWGHSMLDLLRSGSPGQVAAFRGYPLRIGKQVLSTMIASSQIGLGDKNPHLLELVRRPELPAGAGQVRLSAYLCSTPTGRSTGVAGSLGPTGEAHVLVEFALPPFGYVLSLSGEPHDKRPVDISWFLSCGWDEERTILLDALYALPTHEAYPGDYRTRDEMRRDLIHNTLEGEGHHAPADEARRIMAAGEGPAFFQKHGREW